MSKIMSNPVLRLRDKIFPALQGPLVVPLDKAPPRCPCAATAVRFLLPNGQTLRMESFKRT